MPSYRIDLTWEGTAYRGWQVQPHQDTIQARVEAALQQIFAGEKIRVMAAGRTDAGVHALQQIVSFSAQKDRSEADVLRGLNGLLPKDVACLLVEKKDAGFHARRATKEKMYRYRLLNRQQRCPFRRNHTWHYGAVLSLEKMQEACSMLEGDHNFAGFQAHGCSATHTFRSLESCQIHRREDEIHFEVIGNGFLRHQVRIMMGTMVSIGLEKKKVQVIEQILATGERSLAGQTAPAKGLWLLWTKLL